MVGYIWYIWSGEGRVTCVFVSGDLAHLRFGGRWEVSPRSLAGRSLRISQ